jgi:raffinose/stachyose/melibiose transport system substrate-binding protein
MRGSKLTVLVGSLAASCASWAMAAEQTTLTFWTWAPPAPVVDRAIAAFEKANPNIDVKVTFLESTAYQQRLPLALSSGDPVDVAAVQTSSMVKLVKDYLDPLPALYGQYATAPIETQLSPKTLDQAKLLAGDDTLYIAPMGTLGSVVAYYNLDLMAELGLEVPKDRAGLAAFVKTVQEKRPDLVPVAFTGANWFLDEICDTIIEQGSPGWFNRLRYKQGGRFDSPEVKAGFDATVGLFKDGIFGKDTLDLDYGRSVELFQQGKAVMFLQGTWEMGTLSVPFRKANGVKLDNVTVSPLPVMLEGGKPAIRSFIEVGLAVPKNSKHKAEATKFLEFMTTGEGVSQWDDTLFVVPSKQGYSLPSGYFSSERTAKDYGVVADLLRNASSDRNNVSDFSNVVGDALIQSITSEAPTDQQLHYLQGEWDSGRYSNAL